jgi:hypothetical protein
LISIDKKIARNRTNGKDVNVARLVGMGLVLVEILALAQDVGFSSPLTLYLGVASIVVGLVIYVAG